MIRLTIHTTSGLKAEALDKDDSGSYTPRELDIDPNMQIADLLKIAGLNTKSTLVELVHGLGALPTKADDLPA
jgi:hypothetical protein